MEVKFDKIFKSKSELESLDRTNPANVAAAIVHAFANYNPDDTEVFYDMLGYLMGENQTISPMMKQNISDRMLQNDKYLFIGKSYFKGATPENDYKPTSFEVEVIENDYSDDAEGYKRLFLKSGGSDSPRPITLRLAKDGNYYIWSD